MLDGEVSGAWCAFGEGLVRSQSVAGVAEQVDFDGEGVAVADGGAVEMFVLQLGVDYNARILATIAEHIAPAIGWSPSAAPAVT